LVRLCRGLPRQKLESKAAGEGARPTWFTPQMRMGMTM